MKRITALILLVAMLLSLAACGGQPSSGGGTDDSSETASSDTAATEPSEEPTPETDEEPAAGTDEDSTTETPDQTDNSETAPEPVMGVFHADTNTYENELIGLSCQLDEEWHVYSDEEIAQVNGMMVEMMTDEAMAEQLDSSGYVQPFFAQLGEEPVTVNITVENLGLLYGALLDEREYVELSLEQIPSMLESIGLTDITTEVITTTFLGSEHTAVNVTGQLQGIAFYETLVCVKTGRYMACVTAASYLEDLTGDILGMFQAL